MKRFAGVVLALCVEACAVGRVRPAEVQGVAFGRSRLEYCERTSGDSEAAMCTIEARERCLRIQGGPLSVGAADFLATAFTAIGAYFGLGL